MTASSELKRPASKHTTNLIEVKKDKSYNEQINNTQKTTRHNKYISAVIPVVLPPLFSTYSAKIHTIGIYIAIVIGIISSCYRKNICFTRFSTAIIMKL